MKKSYANELRIALQKMDDFSGDADDDVDILIELEDMGFENLHIGMICSNMEF